MNIALGDIVVVVIKSKDGISTEVSGQVESIGVSRYSVDALRLEIFGVGWFDLGREDHILVSGGKDN